MYAFWVGAVISVTLLVTQRLLQKEGDKLGWSSEVPFGPYLVIGTALVWYIAVTVKDLFII